MDATSNLEFQLRGEFAGFVRTREGKKRMVLRAASEELLLKVQRDLRRELGGRMASGTLVDVSGEIRTERFTGETRRVVTKVRPVAGPTGQCTIKVCAKKNCWKQGGKEICRVLEGEVNRQGLADIVRVKAVNCRDECKHAPVLEIAGRVVRNCSPAQAMVLVAEFAAPENDPKAPLSSHP